MSFPNNDELIEVVPRARADLPHTLTGLAAVWVKSDEPKSDAYHLRDPYDCQRFPAIEYINKDWFYLKRDQGKYYTNPRSRIPAPNELGLGTYRTPSPTLSAIPESPTETPSESDHSHAKEALTERNEQSERTSVQAAEPTHPFCTQTSGATKSRGSNTTFKFNDPNLARMATITVHESPATERGLSAGTAEMYRGVAPGETGGEPSGDGGYCFETGGGGPPLGSPSQPRQGGGGYGGPPGGPPSGYPGGPPGGYPGGPPGGGNGPPGWGMAAPQHPGPPIGQPPPPMSGGLKGTAPAIFDGNRTNTKQFSQEFSLYRMINQETAVMRNAYTRTALALSFMRGPAINDWVLQQTERLFTRCNGDRTHGIFPTHQTDDEQLWEDFGHDFRRAFADTASEQRAYGELANYTMGNKSIDEYIAQFEHLLQKAGWDRTSRGSLFQFKKGLDRRIHLKILQRDPMPAETLDQWEEAARKEVERQAFIDASLGPREFRGSWSDKKDQRRDKQGKWKKGVPYHRPEKDPDAMDVDVVRVPETTDQNAREKQRSEGRCFLCNKQGHLKKDCPRNDKGNGTWQMTRPSPTARQTRVEEEENGSDKHAADREVIQEREEILTKMRGMKANDREEILDALVTQEGF